MTKKNILLTGIPRSGTSLLLSLLNKEQHLCFSEPPWLKNLKIASDNAKELTINLKHKIETLRKDIKQNQAIEMVFKKNTSQIPDNYFSRENSGIKNTRETRSVVLPKDQANAAFIIKANALFTANIEALNASNEWSLIAIIRNPVAVLMSWRSVNIASSKGRVKTVEKYSEELQFIGRQEPLLKRQVLLLNWYFKQFQKLDAKQVIYYEQLIKDPQKQIFKSFDTELSENIKLHSKNQRPEYNQNEREVILESIEKYGSYIKEFYPDYSV